MRAAAEDVALDFAVPLGLDPGGGIRETVRHIWDAADDAATLIHYRSSASSFLTNHIKSAQARRFLACLFPATAPALMGLWLLGSLEEGLLSRPIGGAAAFRDQLAASFGKRGGRALLHTTVDEILVDHDRACGVRLGNGEILDADAVVSTASAPETVLRLLGGRYDAALYRRRMADWQMFTPIVMVSLGVARAYADSPQTLSVIGMEPFAAGGRSDSQITVRVFNDDPSFAPPGHTVVQALFESDYDWWARRGADYHAAKDEIAKTAIDVLAPFFPDLGASIRMVDVATPLTFWHMARSWRGAYEGWLPTSTSLFGHVRQTLAGLHHFAMAGQWVEPGGGIPTAILSGRQAMQLLCAELRVPFAPRMPTVREIEAASTL
jgi:phytoene dehydrogenase-like protein